MSNAAKKMLARAYLTGYVDSQQAITGQPKFFAAGGSLIGYFRKELNIIVTPEWANDVVRGFKNGLQS
jgi:hypothetical protein